MFCTSLRRRPSFSQVIPKLTGSENLGLRESQLTTHDLAVPITTGLHPRTGTTIATRQLRVLLFSASAATDDKVAMTLDRIRRFAALTGGQDLAILFLLEAPRNTTFVSAKDMHNSGAATSVVEDGIGAYSKLQAVMMDNPDIPYIPTLLLSTVDGLAELLRKYTTSLNIPKQETKPTATSFELLRLCTANPPMPHQTAFYLSDLFSSLRELAAACTAVSSAPKPSSPSSRGAGFSSQITSTQGSGLGFNTTLSDDGAVTKLKRLRDLIGDKECADIVDFWKEEWVME